MLEYSESRRPVAEKSKKPIDTLVELKSRLQDELNGLPEDAKEQRQALIRQFMADLEKREDLFPRVFQTEKGSWYFVTPEGHSLRVKAKEGSYEVSRPMHRIIYKDGASTRAIMHALKKFGSFDLDRALVGRRIASLPLQVGVTPVEFGLAQTRIAMEEGVGSVRILGTERVNEVGSAFEADTRKGMRLVQPGETFLDTRNILGFHIGHPVTVVKR